MNSATHCIQLISGFLVFFAFVLYSFFLRFVWMHAICSLRCVSTIDVKLIIVGGVNDNNIIALMMLSSKQTMGTMLNLLYFLNA